VILQGSIERFDLVSVLQFLAQNEATGILEVRDCHEYGAIYLVNGRLEGISLPVNDDRLGVHLIRADLLTEDQLAVVLLEEEVSQEAGEEPKPLGQRLVEKGYITEDAIRRAMHNLTMSRIFELVHWRSGTFAYSEPQKMPGFQIAIQGDIQELLLQTQVRIDHGDRPRRTCAAGEEVRQEEEGRDLVVTGVR
jgi:hypothetical protein